MKKHTFDNQMELMKLAGELDKLLAFQAIAESTTLRAAAARLNVSQPSLTKLVQKLEYASGAVLFSRGRNGTKLTPAGEQLAAFAAQTLKGLDDLEKRIRHPETEIAGHLRVGAYASLAEYLWPKFIPALRKKAPALSISIRTSESTSHERALEKGDIDLLVDAEPRLPAGDFISWNLYEDRFGFYAKQPPAVGTEESLPLIFSPQAFDAQNKKILEHVELAGYLFAERIELDSFMAVLAFARAGAGLAVLPHRLAKEAEESRQIQQVSLRGFSSKGFGPHHFTATIHESRRGDARLKFVVRELREWFKT